MTTCPGCREAEKNPRTHVLYLACLGCEARALAGDDRFREAAAAGAVTQAYRSALQRVFGADWKAGHEAVRGWAERMKEEPR